MAAPLPIHQQREIERGQYTSSPIRPAGGIIRPSNVQVERRNPQQRIGGVTRRGATTAVRTAATSGQVAGAAIQYAGKGGKMASRAVMSGGKAAMGVPVVGTVVGGAVTAVGAAGYAASAATETTGRVTRRLSKSAGKAASRTSKTKKKNLLVKKLNPITRGSDMVQMIIGWYLYIFLKLPFAFFGAIFFGIAFVAGEIIEGLEPSAEDGAVEAVAKTVFRFIIGGLSKAFNTVAAGIKEVTGGVIDLAGALEMVRPDTLFLFFYGTFLGIVMFYVLVVGLILFMQGKNIFGGKGAVPKICFFILMIVGYAVPILNLFPWFFPWLIAVNKYPK